MRLALCLIATIATPATAQTSFLDGNALHEMCQGQSRDAAFGYASGALEAVEAMSRFPEANSVIPYCLPSGVRLAQATDVMCKYVADNPADRHVSAGVTVLKAFAEAWPCPGR